MGIRASQSDINTLIRLGSTMGPEAILPVAKARAKGRTSHTPGRQNKTESQYANELALRVAAGAVRIYRFEAIKLRLANATFYSPDFLVILADWTIELHEVKGHWEDDARVKWKVAAEQFPEFAFVAVTKSKGQWIEERYCE